MSPDQTQAKEHLILVAARKRFAYYGFSKVTMDEIASDVGLAKPSLYYYFPTKETLFRAVIGHEQAKFVSDIDSMLSNTVSAAEKLRAFIELRVRLFRELVNLSALGIQSWAEVSSLFMDLFRILEEQEMKFLGAILAAGKEAGELNVENPQQTARLILHALHGLRLRAIHANRGPHITDGAYADLKRDSDHLIELLLTGMQRPPSH